MTLGPPGCSCSGGCDTMKRARAYNEIGIDLFLGPTATPAKASAQR